MELVDILNCRKELTGNVCDKKEVPDHYYRLSIHVWIINDDGQLLIQQRSSNLKRFPNKWTNTGGAAQAGEKSIDTVVREVKEELNLNVDVNKLEFIASYKRDKDYVDVWVLRQNAKISDLKLQSEEVQDVKWCTLEEWLKLVDDGEGIKSSTDYLKKYLEKDFY